MQKLRVNQVLISRESIISFHTIKELRYATMLVCNTLRTTNIRVSLSFTLLFSVWDILNGIFHIYLKILLILIPMIIKYRKLCVKSLRTVAVFLATGGMLQCVFLFGFEIIFEFKSCRFSKNIIN